MNIDKDPGQDFSEAQAYDEIPFNIADYRSRLNGMHDAYLDRYAQWRIDRYVALQKLKAPAVILYWEGTKMKLTVEEQLARIARRVPPEVLG